MKHFLLLLAGFCCVSTILAASNPAAEFEAANKLFAQSKFVEAAAAYEKMIESGTVAPALYFNLGNACFKAGQIGRAITAYRRAEMLSPRDPDLRANLRFARNQVQGPTLRPGLIERTLGAMSLNECTWLCAGAFWVTLGLLALRRLKPTLVGALKSWIILCTAVTVALAVALTLLAEVRLGREVVVVTARDATVRTSPFDESNSAFTANDGAELRVLDRKDAWLQVTDDNRRVGWIRRDAVTLLAAPLSRAT
jgi:tetratricopeptide (TPR) repeat protein